MLQEQLQPVTQQQCKRHQDAFAVQVRNHFRTIHSTSTTSQFWWTGKWTQCSFPALSVQKGHSLRRSAHRCHSAIGKHCEEQLIFIYEPDLNAKISKENREWLIHTAHIHFLLILGRKALHALCLVQELNTALLYRQLHGWSEFSQATEPTIWSPFFFFPPQATKLTNIDRVLPVFQHFCDNQYVNICPVFPVPILEGKVNRAMTKWAEEERQRASSHK